MNNPKGPEPRRLRRQRTVFHYKVDEALRPADRDAYLALLRDPGTRNQDAHRWLLERGYKLSLSVVARHRRRFLAKDADHREAVDRAAVFARLAGSPDAPDFAEGARLCLQHIVFNHLMDLYNARRSKDDDGDDHDDAVDAANQVDTGELLRLGKLVGQCIDMELGTLRRAHAANAKPSEPAPDAPTGGDDDLISRVEAIVLSRPVRG